MKNRLGGRIRLIVSGGAPLSSEVEEFLRVTSCAFVVQGYGKYNYLFSLLTLIFSLQRNNIIRSHINSCAGLTESCGLSTLGFPDEMSLIGTVGSAFVYTEIRLEEVPEMGYDPLGDPPRGEVCLRAKPVFAGYYKNPELTQEVLQDGWFHTGSLDFRIRPLYDQETKN